MASRRSSPQPARRVAVVIEASNAYARGLLSGIRRHVREHDPWTIFLPEHGRGTPPLGPLGEWHGDGVIARIETPAIAAALDTLRRRRPLPIVDVSAVRLIRERACMGIKVQDVVRELRTTRRILDERFTSRVGHTPHDEIGRRQFHRVEQLLVETDLPLVTIAERCGFRHAEYMTVAFTRRHGLPPSRWRVLRKR
jgi:AraC-like DNA-binding protein